MCLHIANKNSKIETRQSKILHTRKCAKSAIDGYYYAGDEFGCVRYQPHERTDEFFGLAVSAHRSVVDNQLAAFGFAAILIRQQEAVLVRQEEPGRDGVYADVRGMVLTHVCAKPLREVADGGFRG